MTYNPLDKENLAKSVVNAFMARPMTSFPAEREELREQVKNHIELFFTQHIEDIPAKLELKTKDKQTITETGAAYDLEQDQSLSSDDSDGTDEGE